MIGIGATRQTGAGRLEVPVNDVAYRLVGHTAVLSLIVSDLQQLRVSGDDSVLVYSS